MSKMTDGDTEDNALLLEIKPVMLKPPLPFKGEYDNIERFIGDCFMYFETFAPYFQLHPQKVAFATSHFEGSTKDWWVHKRQEFWSNSSWDGEPARFRYPSWEEFVGLLTTQFHDPTIEEVHEKRMFDLRMGKGPVVTYFQELEIEAKKAGQRGDDQARGLMVKANILSSYNNWKRCILVMYEEQQKKWVFDQTTSTSRGPAPPQKGYSNTATSNKAGGATSLSPAKLISSTPPRDSGTGKWQMIKTKTYSRLGEPMDIGKLQAEGRCFQCHKKGHLSKDCPEKRDYKDIHLVVQATTEQEEKVTKSKVEEVKDTPVLESQNRYTALSIESTNDNDYDLHPWDDGCDAGDAAATTKQLSRRESGGGDPAMQDRSHKRRSVECTGFGKAISNVTLEPKPLS
ncbi:uncharacterized protein ARMOST_12662 [Armillaria ostoyae]|uniref:CCHC-type domain-containing protein n=1 Tax=Armillaria ostoyae TaxID=47428 RepID=A0A284RKM3_ARMOS|nr:uncharacterized protein ARMOST_12662 [Armillaria ostoyae]